MIARLLLPFILIALIFSPAPAAHAATGIVCIDPGHGGSDPGASWSGIVEKQLNLDVALRLGTILTNQGYSVVYTRTTDISLGNTDRATICNNAKATILVSVHHNASSNHTTDYSSALYQKKVDKKLATAIVGAVAPATSGVNKGIAQFASGVLIKSNMPATISEGYFLTATTEINRLNDGGRDYRTEEAQAIAAGISAYFAA